MGRQNINPFLVYLLIATLNRRSYMKFILENCSDKILNPSKLLILSRVANRCGKNSEAKEFIKRYFDITVPDPRDLKALNFIANKYKFHDELKVYCEEILAVDPSNDRAKKILESVS